MQFKKLLVTGAFLVSASRAADVAPADTPAEAGQVAADAAGPLQASAAEMQQASKTADLVTQENAEQLVALIEANFEHSAEKLKAGAPVPPQTAGACAAIGDHEMSIANIADRASQAMAGAQQPPVSAATMASLAKDVQDALQAFGEMVKNSDCENIDAALGQYQRFSELLSGAAAAPAPQQDAPSTPAADAAPTQSPDLSGVEARGIVGAPTVPAAPLPTADYNKLPTDKVPAEKLPADKAPADALPENPLGTTKPHGSIPENSSLVQDRIQNAARGLAPEPAAGAPVEEVAKEQYPAAAAGVPVEEYPTPVPEAELPTTTSEIAKPTLL